MAVDASARTEPINFCSVFAKNAGEDPIGSAWGAKRFFLAEVALPWPYNLLEARGIPDRVPAAIHELYETHPDWGMIAIAPDPAYSVPGKTRIIDLDFSASPMAQASRRDLLVDFSDVGDTMIAICRDEPLPASVEIDNATYRDLLICTHCASDACCAKFGFPAYSKLRALAKDTPGTRVWRCSHFGGHRFAPTLFDVPDGRYWGFLDDDNLETILHRTGDIESVRGCYRGWAGYDTAAEQLLEREALVREGWDWLNWPQSIEILERNAEDEPIRLAITGHRPSGDAVRYEGAIEVIGEIVTLGTTNGEPHPERVHRIANLARTIHSTQR
ncbi:hypothetical protein BH09CHL1_BH09CHL1_22940 [soil metagenome]